MHRWLLRSLYLGLFWATLHLQPAPGCQRAAVLILATSSPPAAIGARSNLLAFVLPWLALASFEPGCGVCLLGQLHGCISALFLDILPKLPLGPPVGKAVGGQGTPRWSTPTSYLPTY